MSAKALPHKTSNNRNYSVELVGVSSLHLLVTEKTNRKLLSNLLSKGEMPFCSEASFIPWLVSRCLTGAQRRAVAPQRWFWGSSGCFSDSSAPAPSCASTALVWFASSTGYLQLVN